MVPETGTYFSRVYVGIKFVTIDEAGKAACNILYI